mgnify:CR=1 FL=1
MSEDIFGLLMLILLLENGGGTENINQLVIMFLLMNSRNDTTGRNRSTSGCRCVNSDCGRADGFTF